MFDHSEYNALSAGAEKLKYLKKCIDEADREKDFREGLRLRRMYIQESTFRDDNFKAVIMFPEYISLFKEHLHECNNSQRHDFMLAFKWIIEDCVDFYQISMEQVDMYFAEFKRFCEMFGYSLRTYYLKLMMLNTCLDMEEAKKLRDKFKRCKRDEISDCLACEAASDIEFELKLGNAQTAVSMLNDMLTKGIRCGEVPQVVYADMVKYFTEVGNLKEAEHYADMLLPMINGDTNFLMQIAYIVRLKLMTAPMDAYEIINRNVENFVNSKNPKMRFYFADSAAAFFKAAAENGNKQLSLRLPHSVPFYNSDGLYDISQIIDYFTEIADDLAEKFDKRNGTTYFSDIRNYSYPTEPLGNIDLPKHGSYPADAVYFAIPFANGDAIPAPNEIVDAFRNIEGMSFSGASMNEENGVINISGTLEKAGGDITVHVCVRDSDEYQSLRIVNELDEDEVSAEKYPVMLMVILKYNRNFEGRGFTMLMQLIDRLNQNAAPFVADLVNRTVLSAKWVHVMAVSNALPPVKHMFAVHGVMSREAEGRFDFYTTGLEAFGSREIIVPAIEEEQIDFVCDVIVQLAESIIGVADLRDEGIPADIGIRMDGETLRCTWTTLDKVLDGYDAGENADDIRKFAVPLLVFKADEDGILPNFVPAETVERIEFLDSGYTNRVNDIYFNRTFGIAENAYDPETDELIIGFMVDAPEDNEDDYDDEEIAVYVKEVGGKYIIDQGNDSIPQLTAGQEIALDKARIFFWRIVRGERTYFANDSYLLI